MDAAVIARAGTGLAPLEPKPPAWAARLAADRPDRWTHLSEQIPGIASLPANALESAVSAAYLRLASRLGAKARRPVRFWNFVPEIHSDMDDGLDRYMVFNAGRFAAFREWFGAAAFDRHLPTASAVGVRSAGPHGDRLVIHALATTEASAPIENPRQIPAYGYSRRYGPRPPCFARATRLDEPGAASRLLVGGTASIVGEDTRHERDARRQTVETLENLSRLVARARAALVGHAGADATDPLLAFTDLRVYIAREEDEAIVRELVDARFASVEDVEYAQADLCRRELLVEIEGVARL